MKYPFAVQAKAKMKHLFCTFNLHEDMVQYSINLEFQC